MKEAIAVLILTLIKATIKSEAQVCTDTHHLRYVEEKIRITSPFFSNTTATGPVTCAAQCQLRKKCQSFSFNAGECLLYQHSKSAIEFTSDADSFSVFSEIAKWPKILTGSCANHTCPDNAVCLQTTSSDYTCNITGCSYPPPVNNAKLKGSGQVPTETPIGSSREYSCDSGFPIQHGRVECQANGTWTTMTCQRITSCAEVLECDRASVDGEYWIYLKEFQHQRVRVYCHGMKTKQPAEFITLVSRNWGEYPEIQDLLCKGDIKYKLPNIAESVGKKTYTKIKINIRTLIVETENTTFAHGSQRKSQFGTAADCYSFHPLPTKRNSCGTKGTFIVDFSNTGFKLHPQQQWIHFGYQPYISVRRISDSIVKLNCGGGCGGCKPLNHLRLVVNQEEDLALDTATEMVHCEK